MTDIRNSSLIHILAGGAFVLGAFVSPSDPSRVRDGRPRDDVKRAGVLRRCLVDLVPGTLATVSFRLTDLGQEDAASSVRAPAKGEFGSNEHRAAETEAAIAFVRL